MLICCNNKHYTWDCYLFLLLYFYLLCCYALTHDCAWWFHCVAQVHFHLVHPFYLLSMKMINACQREQCVKLIWPIDFIQRLSFISGPLIITWYYFPGQRLNISIFLYPIR